MILHYLMVIISAVVAFDDGLCCSSLIIYVCIAGYLCFYGDCVII